MISLVKNLWPFDESFKKVHNLPEHLKHSARMKNRWRLSELRPFIQRWGVVIGFFSLLLATTDLLPEGEMRLLLRVVLFTAWWMALCFTAFLGWLYSMRLH